MLLFKVYHDCNYIKHRFTNDPIICKFMLFYRIRYDKEQQKISK